MTPRQSRTKRTPINKGNLQNYETKPRSALFSVETSLRRVSVASGLQRRPPERAMALDEFTTWKWISLQHTARHYPFEAAAGLQ